jgi:hypothetical protein
VELVERVDLMEAWGRFPEETLAIVGEGLAAATAPETATAWRRRRQQESISPVEIDSWLHVVWLLADLIDRANGRGTVAKAFAAAGVASYARSLTQPAELLFQDA